MVCASLLSHMESSGHAASAFMQTLCRLFLSDPGEEIVTVEGIKRLREHVFQDYLSGVVGGNRYVSHYLDSRNEFSTENRLEWGRT